MHTEFPALPMRLAAAFLAACSAAVLVPLPAQAQAQRVDVCALVACSASGQQAAVFAEPARTRPVLPPSILPSSVLPPSVLPPSVLSSSVLPSSVLPPSGAPDQSVPVVAAAPVRDPWARHFQGREADDDVCLLNFGLNGQLARKSTLDTHVLGRTQAWRGTAR